MKINIQVLGVNRCEKEKERVQLLLLLLLLPFAIAVAQCNILVFSLLLLLRVQCENSFIGSTDCIKSTKKCDELQSHYTKTGKKST